MRLAGSLVLFLDPASPPELLARALAKAGLEVEAAASVAAAEAALAARPFDLVMAPMGLTPPQGGSLLERLAAGSPGTPIVLTCEPGEVPAAVEAVKAGAADYVLRPLIVEEVMFTLERVLTAQAREANRPPPPVPAGGATIVGGSPRLAAVLALADRAAQGAATVLIGGETGTGKELLARRIHEASPRRQGPFVKVHCGALPEALLESELFGYEKGAFTGAAGRKPGRVELAEQGTLFLDEIGDISPATQVKLLRILQDREYERLGGTQTLKANVRFVTATHRDLEGMVKRREFREDLFYRLNVIRLTLPPLRERPEDIEPLALHFLAAVTAANQLPGPRFQPEALALLRKHAWPGNVRQLQNVVERLALLAEAPVIRAEEVRAEIGDAGGVRPSAVHEVREPSLMSESGESAIDLEGAIRKAELRQIEKALRKARGNRDVAARLLGISRRTLYYKLQQHGLSEG
jgi:two-component system response regulator AtoC